VTSEADWHEWRRGGIGGSDIGALLGLSNWSSPFSLWADKVGLIPPSDTTERQQIGKDAEPFLSDVFTRRTGLYVAGEQMWCEHKLHPWARCTLDGLVYDGPAGEPGELDAAIGTVQFKTDARFGWGNVHDPINGIPAAIEAQCQWELGVTGHHHGWLVVGFAGWNIEIFEIEFRREDFQFMLETAHAFWRDHVLAGVPPQADGSDATARAIADVWPEHQEGVEADLTHLAEQITLRGELKDRIADAEKRLKAIDNAIKAELGDAEVGLVGGHPMFTYRTAQRASYTVEATTYRTLRATPIKRQKEAA
jgi:putative phage-type endonuclease